MPKAELVDGRIQLETEYRDRDLVKSVSGVKYNKDTKQWSTPVSWANCLMLRGVFGDRLELGPSLREWAYAELRDRVTPVTELRARALTLNEEGYADADTEGDERLYPFQRMGVSFLSAASSSILGDEMGTGKTIQGIAFLLSLDLRDGALVVCPKGVIGVWRSELAFWAPELRVAVVTGSIAKRRALLEADEHDVYIINYDLLRSHSRLNPYGSVRLTDKEKTPGELNRPWSAIIADEAHKIADPKSKQSRALKAIGKTCPDNKVAMTGTPMANSPADFWSLLNFVSPDEWPSKVQFIDRYCTVGWNPYGGLDVTGIKPEMMSEFYAVADARFLRRAKAQVLPQLPPKVYIERTVEMGTKQKKAYGELKKGMVTQTDTGQILAMNDLTLLTRLSQFAAAYAEVDVDGKVTLTEPSSKLDELMDIIDELDGEPVVVFAASRQLIEMASVRLTKKGINHGMITGAVPMDQRDWAKEAFQAGRLPVILLTLGAGAEGLTLTAARHLVFLQRSWSLVQNKQAEDRIHRPGAEKHESVFIIDIIAEDTVEEGVITRLEEKEAMLQEIVRDPASLKKFLG